MARIYKGTETNLKLFIPCNYDYTDLDVVLFTDNPNKSIIITEVERNEDIINVRVKKDDLSILNDGVVKYIITDADGISIERQSNYYLKTPSSYEAENVTTQVLKEVVFVENGEYSVKVDDGYIGMEEVKVNIDLPIEEIRETSYSEGKEIGIQEGYASGYTQGSSDGYSSGYTVGNTEGYSSGYTVGNTEGYSSGYTEGSSDGFTTGKKEGLIEGYESGHTQGYSEGYIEGTEIGYTTGKSDQKELLETITINENGTYSREDGYSKVIVEIEDENGSFDEGYASGYTQGSSEGYASGYTEGLNDCPIPQLNDEKIVAGRYLKTYYPTDENIGFSSVEINTAPLTDELINEFTEKGDTLYITENGVYSSNSWISHFIGKSFLNGSYFITNSYIKNDDNFAIDILFTTETVAQNGVIIGGGGFAVEIGDGYIWLRYGDYITPKLKIYPNEKYMLSRLSFVDSYSDIPPFQATEPICIGGYNEGNGVITQKARVHINNVSLGGYKYNFKYDANDFNIYENGVAFPVEDGSMDYKNEAVNAYRYNYKTIEVDVTPSLYEYKYNNFSFYSTYDYQYLQENYLFDFFSFSHEGESLEYMILHTKINDELYKYQYYTKEKITDISFSYFNDSGNMNITRMTFNGINNVHIDTCNFNNLGHIDFIENDYIGIVYNSMPLQIILYKYTLDGNPNFSIYGNSLVGEQLLIYRDYDNYNASRLCDELGQGALVDNNLNIIF